MKKYVHNNVEHNSTTELRKKVERFHLREFIVSMLNSKANGLEIEDKHMENCI